MTVSLRLILCMSGFLTIVGLFLLWLVFYLFFLITVSLVARNDLLCVELDI